MKVKLKVLNFFYLIFSAVAIAAYALNANSFMSATFNYKITSDLLMEEAVDESALEELGIDSDDLFSDLDKIVFEVQVNVGYRDLLSAWTETGPDYNYVDDGGRYTAIERYAMTYILAPALDEAPDYLYEDLKSVANTAISKMIENSTRVQLEKYCLAVVSGKNNGAFDVMDRNPENTEHYNEIRFLGAVSDLADELFRCPTEKIFVNGMVDEANSKVLLTGLKRAMHPYFLAIKNPSTSQEQESLSNCMDGMVRDVTEYLRNYGVIDDEEDEPTITYIDEAIGSILQHLVDHTMYEDDDYSYYEVANNKFISKFFAPLKSYIEEDSEFDNRLTELFINVIRNSNANGENSSLFFLIALTARVFGVLLVVFLLAWLIKFIMCFISFFRQKPYLRINPLFIITGTIEALLALLTLGSVIIYNNFDINSIIAMFPIIKAIVPLGLSFQFIFASWIPGVLAIVNLLFSIMYGPIKKKFKQDSRDEILYSTDFNDYE